MIENLEGVIELRRFRVGGRKDGGALDRASGCFDRALAKDPHLAHAHSNVAVCMGERFGLKKSAFMSASPADAGGRKSQLSMVQEGESMKRMFEEGIAKLDDAAASAGKVQLRDIRLLASGIIHNNKANWNLEYARWLLQLKKCGSNDSTLKASVLEYQKCARAELARALDCASLIPVVHETAAEIVCLDVDRRTVFGEPSDIEYLKAHNGTVMEIVLNHVGSAVSLGYRPYALVADSKDIETGAELSYFGVLKDLAPSYSQMIWDRIQLELSSPGRLLRR
jgi:hypothetical protein